MILKNLEVCLQFGKKKVCPQSIIPCSVTLFKSKLQTASVTASLGSDIGSADVSG
jgi:hypothetical protein